MVAVGGTVGHAEYVARSALGQDASGDLIYAATMSTVPEDLAVALALSGAQTAMELDINPKWVQLAVAHTAGGPLKAPIPGQVRPPTQYLTGWTPHLHYRPGPALTCLRLSQATGAGSPCHDPSTLPAAVDPRG